MPVAATAALYVCYGCWRGGGVGGGVSRRNAGVKGPDDSSRQAMHLRDSIPPMMRGGGQGAHQNYDQLVAGVTGIVNASLLT
jgi:hypothetical protein